MRLSCDTLEKVAAAVGDHPCAALGIETMGKINQLGTLEEVYEPFLIMEGFIKRTPRGREVTDLAYNHLGRKRPGSVYAPTLFD